MSLALQSVSGYNTFLYLSLLTMHVLDAIVGKWLPYLAIFKSAYKYLSLTLQDVSGWHVLLCFKPADDICLWLSSW